MSRNRATLYLVDFSWGMIALMSKGRSLFGWSFVLGVSQQACVWRHRHPKFYDAVPASLPVEAAFARFGFERLRAAGAGRRRGFDSLMGSKVPVMELNPFPGCLFPSALTDLKI